MRLIDANVAKENLFTYYSFVNEDTCKSNYTGETLMSYEVADMIEDCIENTPTIDPETLPIVRELREKLMLTEANQNHFKEERDLFLFKMKETAEAATSEIDRRNETICELREKLERVTAERDVALKQLSDISDCDTCKHTECIPRGGRGKCKWEWNIGTGDNP